MVGGDSLGRALAGPPTYRPPPCTAPGHSLGGALATLASLEIARAHPKSTLTTYILGCPRVGGCLSWCVSAMAGVQLGLATRRLADCWPYRATPLLALAAHHRYR